MAVFAGSDLKKWRESQGISAADLAEQISCDTTTIYRYESGKLKPDPDTMYEICERLGDVDRWTTWMRTEYPRSYARISFSFYRANAMHLQCICISNWNAICIGDYRNILILRY